MYTDRYRYIIQKDINKDNICLSFFDCTINWIYKDILRH